MNAEVTSDIKKTMSMPEIIKEILNIVRYTMLIDFKEDSISYERFLTHLKFFVQRAISRKYYDTDEQFVLFEEIKNKCREEYNCALKIKNFMEKKTGYIVSDEEILYLTLHINRIKLRSE